MTPKMWRIIESWRQGDERYNENNGLICGFTVLYHGSSSTPPGYCGIRLGGFDEVCDSVALFSNRIIVRGGDGHKAIETYGTPEQHRAVMEMINALDNELLAEAPNVGVYLIFSTS